MPEIPTVIVGTKFRGVLSIEVVGKMGEGDAIRLEREPENKRDLNAVACYFLGRHVGYIPKQANAALAKAMDAGAIPVCICAKPALVRGSRLDVEPKVTVAWSDP
jgi:hypothetical protein